MEVTGLKTNARVPDYVTVVIDGTRFASLPVRTVEALRLQVGTEIKDDLKLRLDEAAEIEKTYQRALRMLDTRPRASHDLIRRLRAKGHDPSACAEVVGRLETSGALDDKKFATLYAVHKADKGFGRFRIISDLRSQGVEGHVAEIAVDSAIADNDEDPLAGVRALAEKKMRQMHGLDRTRQKRRLLAYLARRGFGGGDVWELVEEVLG